MAASDTLQRDGYALLRQLVPAAWLHALREVLEEGLIRRIAGTVTEAELDALDEVVTGMEAAVHAGRPFPELDRAFHELLYASLGNALVPQLLGAFWTVFRRVAGARGWTDDPEPQLQPPPFLGRRGDGAHTRRRP